MTEQGNPYRQIAPSQQRPSECAHTGRAGLDTELSPPQSKHQYLRVVRQAA